LSKYSNATIKLIPKESDYDGVRVEVEDLGIELNFSKSRVKEALIQFIEEAI
ncbi:MAG: F0F1 ATP synthase subunit delta, partial [Epsilonproteobacteria bacterium]|nr:F0F1 ATP synthase subunit delta [Campylobacterota bacterium]